MLISLLLVSGTFLPADARASVFSDFLASITPKLASASQSGTTTDFGNLQTMMLLKPAMNINPAPATGGGDITIIDDGDTAALVAEEGPSGTIADIQRPKNGTITTYIVQPGDTLGSIAKMFSVSTGTILAANDISSGSKLQVGKKLIILPITSIPYTVKKGDTLASIAKRYGGDATEIANYNGVDDATLAVGTEIIIPNGEVPASATVTTTNTRPSGGSKPSGVTGSSRVFANNSREPAHDIGAPGTPEEIAYYIAPLTHYIVSQKIHGYNAVDLAAPKGTPIMAAAAGYVVVAKEGGWNGGYGSYVVIAHENGSETLYSHMSEVDAYDGETVAQGQVIGKVGQTGEATGPHVHFEIRNGIRNPFTQTP